MKRRITKHVLACLMVVAPLLAACGGRQNQNNLNLTQYELDKRHCTANSECTSGLCANGRCG